MNNSKTQQTKTNVSVYAELRYRANNTKDTLFYSKEGFMDLALSKPVMPENEPSACRRGLKIIRVKIVPSYALIPSQGKKYLAELIWARKERRGKDIVEDAHYMSAEVFNTPTEARNFLNQYVELDKYKKELVE